ncbi:MAG TPA: hypothetical protein VFA81_05315 [Burkholderiales bacterium]|nr:hypothetical protein [Burkholderiales bacterium]
MRFGEWVKHEAPRWIWFCPLVALVLAVLLLVLWGFTFWTAIIVALLLVCPALLLWGAFYLSRN